MLQSPVVICGRQNACFRRFSTDIEGPCVFFNKYLGTRLDGATQTQMQDLLMSPFLRGMHIQFQMKVASFTEKITGQTPSPLEAAIVSGAVGNRSMLVSAYIGTVDWIPVLMCATDTDLYQAVFQHNASDQLRCFRTTEARLDAPNLMLCLLANAQRHPLPPSLARTMAARHQG